MKSNRKRPPEWIDASRPISTTTPVWPGDREIEVRQLRIGEMTVSSFSGTCHAGTHVDAPLHLDPNGAAIDELEIGRLIGRSEVVVAEASSGVVELASLPVNWKPRSDRVLIRTDSYPVGAPIDSGFAGLSVEVMGLLIQCGVSVVGIDTPSVDRYDSQDLPIHHGLQAAGVIWIEGLDLSSAPGGLYEMIALPIALAGTEAAPARVLLRKVEVEKK